MKDKDYLIRRTVNRDIFRLEYRTGKRKRIYQTEDTAVEV